MLLGEPNGLLYRCRLNLNAYGMSGGSAEWFTGAGVTARVDSGVLTLVP